MSDRQNDRDLLIHEAIVLFLLSDDAITAFSQAIYDARIQVLADAYAVAAADLGIDASDAAPSDELLAQMTTESQDNAMSIVTTYNADVTSEATRFVDTWADEHETFEGCEAALQNDLTIWAAHRADWKAAQIALYESGKGYSAGIDWLVSDLLAGDLALPEEMALSDLVVRVEPDDATEPICAELVAGNPYPMDAADDVLGSVFPIHPGCVHYATVDVA
jgi:hypothetical protein